MINIRVTQRTIFIDQKKLRHVARAILHLTGYEQFDIGIWITTDRTIKRYNAQYRNKNKATDILSFPVYPQLKPGQRIRPTNTEEKNLGDIIISAQRAANDAHALGLAVESHLSVLLVHGICHLLGYDHTTEDEYRRMRAKERYLLAKIGSASKSKTIKNV